MPSIPHSQLEPPQDNPQERESALIARILAGETNLFHDLIRPYERRVFVTALAMLRDPAEAEDVVQETMLKAYRNLQSFRGEAKFSTWLTVIAQNEGRAKLRKASQHVMVSIDAATEEEDGHCHHFQLKDWREIPSEALERKDISALLQTAVLELPEIYRTVFMLRDVEEVSMEEAARVLCVTVGTAKVRLHRARLLLQKRLAPTLQKAMPLQKPLPAKKGLRVARSLAGRKTR